MKISFIFKPLQIYDLDLLCTWFEKPHVQEWWTDRFTDEEIKEKYGSRIGSEEVVPFIVWIENKPIGFIQYYHAAQVGDGW